MSERPAPLDRRALLKQALDALDQMQAKLDAAERRLSEPIAVVGMACRVPGGVASPEAFWTLLRDGVDAIREAPADRWDAAAYARLGLPEGGPVHPGGFLDQIDRFDARFFGLSPREAATMDPQHRLLLEVCWEGLEHAGQAPDRLAGSRTGVFIGISTWEYSDIVKSVGPEHVDLHASTGSAHNTAAGRISYVLGLRGPSLAVDTACSSSLVAVHLACESLRRGESRLALAGGVNAIVLPDAFGLLTRAGALAPDGRCKTFDEAADGFVRAEGCGIVVLKRLSDALTDQDPVFAVIPGSAINQDGASSGLTVPNGLAQQEVIRQALAVAKVAPADVAYVEAHGTGTSLGDPIELEALASVLGQGRRPDNPLIVGSVKTNIGHLEAAAGVIGLIKVVLALQKEEIPPHLHFKTFTSRAALEGMPLVVPTSRMRWPSSGAGRIAGVSAFGLSGTNAHVIVTEAPAIRDVSAGGPDRPMHLLALSAKTEPALSELVGRYAHRLAEAPTDPGDLCWSAATGRAQLPHRLAVPVRTAAEARETLEKVASGQVVGRASRGRARSPRPRLAFLFTGQGAQYVDMGRELYRTNETFRQVLDRCDARLRAHLPRSLLSVMYPEAGAASPLDDTQYTQPALFALEYALAETWRAWGVTPSLVLGHSVGEYVAACVAGVLDLDDALCLVAARGRLMQSLPAGGAMAAVFASETDVTGALAGHADHLAIAAINAPDNVVLSGSAPVMAAALERLAERGIRTQRMTVSHAFHSPLMDPILDEFEAAAREVRFSPPRIGLVSNVTGRLAGPHEVTSATYWRRHVRAPVRFAAGMAALREQGIDIFLEAGPAPTLLGLGRRVLGDDGTVWLPSLRRGVEDWPQMLESLGRLWVEGVDVDWSGFDRPHPRRKIAVPTYPFQRERYWVEPHTAPPTAQEVIQGHPLLGRRVSSPRLRETVFEYAVRPDRPTFLGEHRIHGTVVFPGTAYVETMLAAGRAALDRPIDLEDVMIQAPMILDDQAGRTVQVIVGPAGDDGAAAVEVFSRPLNDERPEVWQAHAAARVVPRRAEDGCGHAAADAREGRRLCSEPVGVREFYEFLTGIGLDYGPTFRGIRELWRGEREGLGLVEVDAARLPALDKYQVHPAVLDACLHLFGVTVSPTEGSAHDVYVPVGVERIRFFRPLGSRVWGRVTLAASRRTEDTLVGDLHLFDDAGAAVACLSGLSFRRMTPEALGRAVTAGWLHEVVWRFKEPQAGAQTVRDPGQWLLLADRGGLGAALAQRLEEQGHRCELVFAGGAERDEDPSAVDLSSPEGFARWWARRPVTPIAGIVHLWSLDAPGLDDAPAEALEFAERLGVASVLALVQAIGSEASAVAKVVLVTRGAQRAGAEAAVAPAQAPVWGLARVVRSEYPSLEIACVDLDLAATADEGAALAAEVLATDREDEVALRADGRRVARLTARIPTVPLLAKERSGPIAALRLEIPARGVLDNLTWRSVKRTSPGAGQVEIEVRASGLNFRDVLNTLGLYPGDAGALGSECAGVLTAVGAGVDGLRPGDEVIAMANPAFATYVTAEAALVVRKPPGMTMAEAVTLPVTFLTAVYGLHDLGRIKPGERVLIHAAAGGVGLAALQVARRAGAEIFATAGSPSKREYLTTLGVRHVMDSRSANFADEVMVATNGEGIDLVLNSLTGDLIPAGLRILRPGGRFVEIGKRGIWDQAKVAAEFPGVTYHVFYLGEVGAREPASVGARLREVVDDVARGALAPLPHRTFGGEAVAEAFRYMAQARHVGKVVVTPPVPDQPAPLTIRSDAAYLVTGGLGALGLQVARWLHDEGARHLVLMGRSEPSGSALETIEILRSRGSRVCVMRGDVTCLAEVTQVLADIGRDLPPLRGVVHAAGVLDDGVLAQQSRVRFARVMAPKVVGAVNLHRLTVDRPLDLFVLFSSASALLGSPGQANYVAANAFLDALAHHRRALGLPATSINWGPWAGAGMAAAAAARGAGGTAPGGVRWISPERGRALLAQAVRQPVAQLGVVSIDWQALAAVAPALASRSLLAELVRTGAEPRGNGGPTPGRLRAAAAAGPGERTELMVAALRDHLAAVLRTSAEGIDSEDSLGQLGVDSLMAVELKNRIELDLGAPVPVAELLEASSLRALAAVLSGRTAAARLDEDDRGETTSRPPEAPGPAVEEMARRGNGEPDGAAPHPASHGQQALWFLHRLAPDSPAYHVLFAGRIRSAIEPGHLQAAFQALVDRHPALRTTFAIEGERVVQRVHPRWPVEIEQVDAPSVTSDELRRLVEAAARRPFDLERGPIVRATLVHRSPDEHVLLLAIHHIGIDAWSLDVLLQDLGDMYAAAVAGRRPLELAPPSGRYSDFVDWQRTMLEGPGGQRARRYWEAELGGDLPVLALPTDRPRLPRPRFRGRSLPFLLDERLSAGLRELAAREGSTPYMLLMAAYQLLLRRVTNQHEILVGSPVAGRARPEFASIVGYFVNTVVVRATTAGNPRFRAFLREIRDKALKAIEHQDYPFPLLVQQLGVGRDGGRTPVFQTLFNFIRTRRAQDLLRFFVPNHPSGAVRIGGLVVEPFPLFQQEGQFDLELEMSEVEKVLGGRFKYDTDLFDERTIARLAAVFEALLEVIVEDPDHSVSSIVGHHRLRAAEAREAASSREELDL